MKKHLLPLHFTATLLMTGSLWVIHIVHYRLFDIVGSGSFELWSAYEDAHMFYIGLWVGPLMLFEAATAALLLKEERSKAYVINAALLTAIWIITGLFAGPIHVEMLSGFTTALYDDLMFWNLVRTFLWSIRSALLYRLLFSRKNMAQE